jgi:hypothetical protein
VFTPPPPPLSHTLKKELVCVVESKTLERAAELGDRFSLLGEVDEGGNVLIGAAELIQEALGSVVKYKKDMSHLQDELSTAKRRAELVQEELVAVKRELVHSNARGNDIRAAIQASKDNQVELEKERDLVVFVFLFFENKNE